MINICYTYDQHMSQKHVGNQFQREGQIPLVPKRSSSNPKYVKRVLWAEGKSS